MPPKSQHVGSEQHVSPNAAPPPPAAAPKAKPAPAAPIGSKLSGARAAIQQFLTTELGARELRITKIAPIRHGDGGWSAEAEILVPNLEVKMLGLPLTQEVLERETYTVELDEDLTVRAYGHIEEEEA
ncbi:hypothetical protein OGR47_11580 [Methylocystis sp. MJC1]|jgi:hypothetical protein|uniref:hypothetical protein n=1 Tax=Methylocystis sp. MJC1 TaxID=2654282 RepID=UPI0013EA7C63|nr:hypothetical protein [Methylocystis sp. MJC1]KAF2990124.1 hypothetical protein MJC1_02784 [Methylocystis sp. MJC1]MBU6527620.1 hypothetical protein [Methylocystis sp. MJC1]UZX10561.1 hypothetical protein OGR47_11580 [Methylocystis sp. MJC1]